MTVKYKHQFEGGHGCGGRKLPRRIMIAEDLGLDLLVSPWDPDLLAVGIKAPRLTGRQRNTNMMRAIAAGKIGRRKGRVMSAQEVKNRYFMKTAAGKKTRNEISAILQRVRWSGECRG